MTGFPARKFGFADRGTLEAGKKADLVLFNPVSIMDCGTFEDPHREPAGIVALYVNGKLTVKGGKPTGVRAGKVLRRAA